VVRELYTSMAPIGFTTIIIEERIKRLILTRSSAKIFYILLG